jgi:hypothetical protein
MEPCTGRVELLLNSGGKCRKNENWWERGLPYTHWIMLKSQTITLLTEEIFLNGGFRVYSFVGLMGDELPHGWVSFF